MLPLLLQILKKIYFPLLLLLLLLGAVFCFEYFTRKHTTGTIVSSAASSQGENHAADTPISNTDGDIFMEETSQETETFLAIEEATQEEKAAETRSQSTAAREENMENIQGDDMEEGPLPVNPNLLYLITDTHYYPQSMSDFQKAFRDFVNQDDGKDIQQISFVLDAWIQQVIAERPAVVILSGDLSFNGEEEAHRELAAKLEPLLEENIQVLVVPGNHDIFHPNAATYFGEERKEAKQISPEEFYEIYHHLGYDQSSARDPASLSYCYTLDEHRKILMLDSAVYEPSNYVYGTIKKETLVWMEEILREAQDNQEEVIVVAHHNLLSESRLYTTEVTLTNNGEVISLLNRYHVKLYLSGHLHLQRIREYRKEPGVEGTGLTEVVTGAFAMYPFPFGKILWQDERIHYIKEETQMEQDLREGGLAEFQRVYAIKIGGGIWGIPEDMKKEMYGAYTDLILSYVEGKVVDEKEFRQRKAFEYFDRFLGEEDETMLGVERMLRDTKQDNNHAEIDLSGTSEKLQ